MKPLSIGLVLCLVPTLIVAQQKSSSKTIEVVHGVSISLPAPWFLANRTTNGVEVAYPPSGKSRAALPGDKPQPSGQAPTVDARIAVVVEDRESHADAVARLREIASERPGRPQLLVIQDGRPFTGSTPHRCRSRVKANRPTR